MDGKGKEATIFVGDQTSATNKNIVDQLNIKYIINLAYPHVKYNHDGIKQMNINIDDHPSSNIRQHFQQTRNFIDNGVDNGNNVLIHCAAGISRSATIAIDYLMHKLKMPYDNAFQLVKNRRNIINPNDGFKQQLRSHVTQ